MKNYKFLIPVVLIILYIVSLYRLQDIRKTEQQQYDDYIAAAREKREQGILVDTIANYESALSLKPSLQLYLEIGEFYEESNQTDAAIDWGLGIVSKYPKRKEGYEFLTDLYIESEDNIACYNLYDKMNKRAVKSEYVDNCIKEIEYSFYLKGAYVDVGIYSDGFCPVVDEERMGYTDLTGSMIISAGYDKVGYFSEGLAPVVDSEGSAYFIDTEGNKKHVVLNVEDVQELTMINEGVFALYNGKSWGYYNLNHKYLFGEYEAVSSIGNGIAAVKESDKWYLIDKSGKKISDTGYDKVIADEKGVVYRNERIFVQKDNNYYMVDDSGKQIADNTYEDADMFRDETYAAVQVGGKWGFINKAGEMVIEPQYEEARSFSNGFAAVKYDDMWGFIDEKGNPVIEAQFEGAKDFNTSGCAYVFDGEAWTLLILYKYNH